MKKIISFLLLLNLPFLLKAQQRPHFTQYILNNYVLNPALSGIENYTDLRLGMRNQWMGIDGAPRTIYATAHMPLGKKDYKLTALSVAPEGENPRGRSYWENYEASPPHHGVGIKIMQDRSGLFTWQSFSLSYAYHLGLGGDLNLAAGFAPGLLRVAYDVSKATPASGFDPALNSNAGYGTIVPDLSAGLWLYSSSLFGGVSVLGALPQTVSLGADTLAMNLVPHFFGTAGVRFLLGEDVNVVPSIMIKYVNGLPLQGDLNVKFQYRDFAWIGGSFRSEDGFAGMLGLSISNTLHLGYSYDYSSSSLRTVSKGSHELVLGFLIGNTYGDSCPRNVW